MVTMQLIFTNEYGEFIGKKVNMGEEDYKKLVEICKNFYNNNGFELSCEDGSFVIFPPEIVKKSFLTIKKIENNIEKAVKDV